MDVRRRRSLRLVIISPRDALFSNGIRVIALPKRLNSFSILCSRTPLVSSLVGNRVGCARSRLRGSVKVSDKFIRIESGVISTYIRVWCVVVFLLTMGEGFVVSLAVLVIMLD